MKATTNTPMTLIIQPLVGVVRVGMSKYVQMVEQRIQNSLDVLHFCAKSNDKRVSTCLDRGFGHPIIINKQVGM